MSRLYPYVGPSDIRARARQTPPGTVIDSQKTLTHWMHNSRQVPDRKGLFAVTYVVDEHGQFRVADRGSEHVACAAGQPVRAAGEMFLEKSQDGWEVVEVSNHSTGYCPDPECWPEVARALEALGIPHPGAFTRALIFRECGTCGQWNVVKDGWFVCGMCEADLPVLR